VALDDLLSSESAFVAAVTAAVLSPKTRDTMRKGAVYGLAGVLKAGDVVAGAARGAVRGVRGDEAAASDGAARAADAAASKPAETTASSPASGPRRPGTTGRRAASSKGQTSA